MSRIKIKLRAALLAVLAVPMFFLVGVAPAFAGPKPYPPGAVSAYRDSVTVYWAGTAPNCQGLRGNPFGYALFYKTYSGWSYVSAGGTRLTRWYGSWTRTGTKAVSGPLKVETTSATNWKCSLDAVKQHY